jgi:PIN domain nuclease of toxin-antitoxin system
MNYLLDSCTLLWLVNGAQQFSTEARRACSEPGASLHISAASAWEIAVKHERGKLVLQLPMSEWWQKALDHHGLLELPVTASIAIASAALPRVNNDPFDRAIVATAREHRLSILTPDLIIKKYPEVKTVW